MTRRVHSITVQTSCGKLHLLQGDDLPETFVLKTGTLYSGAHAADVLLSPKRAFGLPVLPHTKHVVTKRDAFFLLLGIFAFHLLRTLAESAAYSMTG